MSSTSSIYRPKACAFHPKESIFNFCKSQECLLPMCPSCVKVHTDQHKAENTHGTFENMGKTVDSVDNFLQDIKKQLYECTEDINEATEERGKLQQQMKKKLIDAKAKAFNLVERFFNDFQKQISKSLTYYNDSMKENFGSLQSEIQQLQQQIKNKTVLLSSDKVLKTVISFYSKGQEETYKNKIIQIKQRIFDLNEQKVDLVCHQNASQKIIDELGKYIHLQFLNWESEIKYVEQFVKTGFSTKSGNFSLEKTH